MTARALSLLLFAASLALLLYLANILTPVPSHFDPHEDDAPAALVLLGLPWGLLTWGSLRASKAVYRKVLGLPRPAEGRFAIIPAALFVFAAIVFWVAWFQDLPHFKQHMRQSHEGVSKGNLAEARTALAAYAKANQGEFPSSLDLLVGDPYLPALRGAKAPFHHQDSATVKMGKVPDDAGGWLYDPAGGTLRVNCTHTDTKGKVWADY